MTVNSYVPNVSVYSVYAGAYIMHESSGVDIKQPSSVPMDVYPDGHEPSAIVIYSITAAT